MTIFSNYYFTKQLAHQSMGFVSVFASSTIEVYPFQVVASQFALQGQSQQGVILCDESGMGKSHEVLLVAGQYFYVGKTRICILIPNGDLLMQWKKLISEHYTIPCSVIATQEELRANENSFLSYGVVLTTYDFAVENEKEMQSVGWDLMIFEEATALCSVYQEDNVKAKVLKKISVSSYIILLTGTPIEKNIMDLYGLIYFIDETILDPPEVFLKRYLRKPENYPELAKKVAPYCFRTLRSSAKQYADVKQRQLITLQYTLTEAEQKLYDLLSAYCNRENKKAFPKMDSYDLSLQMLGLLGSSTAAVLQTIKGIIKRLQNDSTAYEELLLFQEMEALADKIDCDAKTTQLLLALQKIFPLLKKAGANRKAVIFTESVQTQKYLFAHLKEKYKTTIYNGSTDYSAIEEFQIKTTHEILITTDSAARGFNLEQCSFVVQYDLLFNTLKMEQRIDRCHRLGQKNDVVVLAFINQNNFADVRKLELVNKRLLVSDGVFGVSDHVIGGFAESVSVALADLKLRTQRQIESDYESQLKTFAEQTEKVVHHAEEILFTTFSMELAKQYQIVPTEIQTRVDEIQERLWASTKYFFEQYNLHFDDCYFEIDERERTITATNYEKLPTLFYYFNGKQNQKYISQKKYGMAKDFKPHHGRITLTSILGKGVLNEIACSERGIALVKEKISACEIGFYIVKLKIKEAVYKEIPILAGRTADGKILTHAECEDRLKKDFVSVEEIGTSTVAWLKSSSKYHEVDALVDTAKLIATHGQALDLPLQHEVESLKKEIADKKARLGHEISDIKIELENLKKELEEVTADRMKLLILQKDINGKKKELQQKEERQFFSNMELDLELETQVQGFLEGDTLQEVVAVEVVRHFLLEVRNA
ncbi:MAG: SNF2-related protein [Bacillota bacterium]